MVLLAFSDCSVQNKHSAQQFPLEQQQLVFMLVMVFLDYRQIFFLKQIRNYQNDLYVFLLTQTETEIHQKTK